MKSKRRFYDASDPQAEKCYEWQFKWADWNRKAAPMSDLRKVVSKVCKAYGLPPIPVRSLSKHRHYSMYQEETRTIGLLPGHQNVPMTLHEAAHAIVHSRFPRAPDHGPTFMGVFLGLLEQSGVAPRAALFGSARKAGLRWRKFTYHDKKKAR